MRRDVARFGQVCDNGRCAALSWLRDYRNKNNHKAVSVTKTVIQLNEWFRQPRYDGENGFALLKPRVPLDCVRDQPRAMENKVILYRSPARVASTFKDRDSKFSWRQRLRLLVSNQE